MITSKCPECGRVCRGANLGNCRKAMGNHRRLKHKLSGKGLGSVPDTAPSRSPAGQPEQNGRAKLGFCPYCGEDIRPHFIVEHLKAKGSL